MNVRQALLDRAAGERLPAAATRRLLQLAGLGEEPAGLAAPLARGLAVLAAAFGGFGVVLWVAANWPAMGPLGRFALLQGAVLVCGVGAWARPATRAPLGLLAFLGIGALFASFGQTYQTGADPWQLFAVWAVVGLPLCLGARSDVLWAPWSVVALVGVSLWAWTHTRSAAGWMPLPHTTPVQLAAWVVALAVVFGLGPSLRRHTGAGPWAMRTSVTLAVVAIGASALSALFGAEVPLLYGAGLAVVATAGALLSRRSAFDVYALSAVALTFDTLAVCGLARLLIDAPGRDATGALLVTGLVAAGLLALSVQWVLRRARTAPHFNESFR